MKKNIFVISLFLSVFIGLLLGTTIVAADKASDLPPRPPTATPMPPTGGLIILSVQATKSISNDLWTIVQWQDVEGNWHDVEGWQGTFNEVLQVIWWVAPNDLGKGPFRWVVYENQESDEIVTVSQSFHLPSKNNGIVEVEVLLP